MQNAPLPDHVFSQVEIHDNWKKPPIMFLNFHPNSKPLLRPWVKMDIMLDILQKVGRQGIWENLMK